MFILMKSARDVGRVNTWYPSSASVARAEADGIAMASISPFCIAMVSVLSSENDISVTLSSFGTPSQ